MSAGNKSFAKGLAFLLIKSLALLFSGYYLLRLAQHYAALSMGIDVQDKLFVIAWVAFFGVVFGYAANGLKKLKQSQNS